MNLFLILVYILENVYFVYRIYKQKMGIFTPVFIFSMMSLGVILPQLTTIYVLKEVYNPLLIPNLIYIMITSNLAFFLGWKQKMVIENKGICVIEIKKKYLKFFIIVFSICSFLFTHFLKSNISGVDGVIAFQFQGLGLLGLILCIIYIIRFRFDWFSICCLIVSTVPILEYALSIYGSRQSLFTTALLYAYLLTHKFPAKYNLIKRCFMVFFVVGMIGSMSIVAVRNSISSEEGYSTLKHINFIDNMKTAFSNSYSRRAGMDLGNAALCIDRCQKHGLYNYGLFLWNGFVFNYVPRRLVGEDFKKSLQYSDGMGTYMAKVTHGITCTTGYYDAFSSFSYLGFIVFYLLARLFKFFYIRRKYSAFYEMIFLFILVNSSVAVTHGIQLVFSKLEFIGLLFLCLFFTLHKSRRRVKPGFVIDKK